MWRSLATAKGMLETTTPEHGREAKMAAERVEGTHVADLITARYIHVAKYVQILCTCLKNKEHN